MCLIQFRVVYSFMGDRRGDMIVLMRFALAGDSEEDVYGGPGDNLAGLSNQARVIGIDPRGRPDQ